VRNEPNLAAHALVAAFCVFIIWWGVRQLSQLLVNLGVVGFAITVGWFYFSSLFDKMGRSLGLIGLGVLFLAGGWALEKMRRNLVAGMGETGRLSEAAQ
jgi:TRAP-type C4-dicarboxylate transport system permease small subunit